MVTWPEMVHGRIKRRQKEYSDPGKAQARYDELRKRFPIVGASGLSMDSEARADYHAARRLLPAGVSLADAARHYLAHRPERPPQPITEPFAEWLALAARTDKGKRTSKDRKNRVEAFLAAGAITDASQIDVAAVDKWLWRGVKGQTATQDASDLRGFCRYLVKRRYLTSNPVDAVELPDREDPDPRTLDAAQVNRLLEAATRWNKGKMVPFFAVALFAGLRPSEIQRLTPDLVKLDTDEPFTRVRKLKRGRGVRITPITTTLQAWLAAHPLKYPVYWSKKGFEKIRQEAGLFEDWQCDMMRHTCISAWLATGWSEDAVAAASGNSPRIIHRHYRELLTAQEGIAVLSALPLEKLRHTFCDGPA